MDTNVYFKDKLWEERSWEEFISSKILWYVNMIIHVFGWAIMVFKDTNGNIEKVIPARVCYRGFEEDANRYGYIGLTEYLAKNANELLEEISDEE